MINDIFISMLLNKGMSITRNNIEAVTKVFYHRLAWFQEFSLHRRDRGDENWEMYFLASATYFNIQRLVSGFLAFVRIVFKHCPNVTSIPMLMCTTSCLEAVFSMLRAVDNQPMSLAVFNGRIGTINARDATKYMANSSYDKRDVVHGGMFKDTFLNQSVPMKKKQERVELPRPSAASPEVFGPPQLHHGQNGAAAAAAYSLMAAANTASSNNNVDVIHADARDGGVITAAASIIDAPGPDDSLIQHDADSGGCRSSILMSEQPQDPDEIEDTISGMMLNNDDCDTAILVFTVYNSILCHQTCLWRALQNCVHHVMVICLPF